MDHDQVRISLLQMGRPTPAAKMPAGETGRREADRHTPLDTGGDTRGGTHKQANASCILRGC